VDGGLSYGIGIGRINKVTLHQAQLLWRWVTIQFTCKLSWYVTIQSSQLSLLPSTEWEWVLDRKQWQFTVAGKVTIALPSHSPCTTDFAVGSVVSVARVEHPAYAVCTLLPNLAARSFS